MTTKSLTTDIHNTYQMMIDAVEEFVVKEGKTVPQALDAAEKKLNESSVISKDEIKQVKRDLKDKLRLLAENAEGVSEAYKEQIKLNMAYVSTEIWDKLLKISDSNTAHLIAFKREREEAQLVLTSEHLSAHQEHNLWNSEYDFWVTEANLWKSEHDQAIDKLTDIKKILKQQSKVLHEHVHAIEFHKERDHDYEVAMANAEKDPGNEDFRAADQKEAVHQKQERKIHEQYSEMHHVLKVQHYKIMGMINMLHKKAT
ncbi:zinc ribbon-containing protein [Leucothrix arctica]|uniref:Uncharacterized protein n=1 Tax=Leucothrix arctica TaxID=1481894 RepID=A0A317C676_9GAMM|nr:hypothetical protein [Leucothrix arctica]PWQ93807.1 hypothetical protein DKT75_19585 [Leucothrix arctica]